MRRRGLKRAGITREQSDILSDLHRDVVMIRARAALFTDTGRKQWFGKCEWCMQPKWLQVAHIEPVGRVPHLRWDPENARALCYRCHIHTGHKWPRKFEAWITQLIGTLARDALAARADVIGWRPDYMPTRLHLIACRVKLNQRHGSNPLLAVREG